LLQKLETDKMVALSNAADSSSSKVMAWSSQIALTLFRYEDAESETDDEQEAEEQKAKPTSRKSPTPTIVKKSPKSKKELLMYMKNTIKRQQSEKECLRRQIATLKQRENSSKASAKALERELEELKGVLREQAESATERETSHREEVVALQKKLSRSNRCCNNCGGLSSSCPQKKNNLLRLDNLKSFLTGVSPGSDVSPLHHHEDMTVGTSNNSNKRETYWEGDVLVEFPSSSQVAAINAPSRLQPQSPCKKNKARKQHS
jgi:predicted RNase H-like nuclease (RuvC/YqgF family)